MAAKKNSVSVTSRPKDSTKPEQDTRFEGYVLLRENGKHNKRYLVLSGPSLYCFKSNSETEPKAIYYLTDWQVVAVEGTKLKHIIHLIRERPVTEVEEILALSAEDKVAWMNALMKEKNKILAARAPKSPVFQPEPEPLALAVKQVIEEDAEHTFITGKTTQLPSSATGGGGSVLAGSHQSPPPTMSSVPPVAASAPDSSLGIHAMMPTIIRCLQHLHRIGAETTPQIFGVPGDIHELVRLKEQAAASSLELMSAKDPLCVAQLVRLLLDGNVHEPLLRWDNARALSANDLAAFPTPLHRIDRVRAIVQTLAQDEQGVLRELMMFLHKVDKNAAQSRMNGVALSSLFFKRIICSREVSLSLMAPDELEKERQVYIEMVATLIRRANRLFNITELPSTEEVNDASQFARQIGSDGLLFLMKQEVSDLYSKFNAMSSTAASWRQLDQDTAHMRQDLKELKAHEANSRLRFDKELDEVDTLVDSVRPHYLNLPEKAPVIACPTQTGSKSSSGSSIGASLAPTSVPVSTSGGVPGAENSSGIGQSSNGGHFPWQPQPRRK